MQSAGRRQRRGGPIGRCPAALSTTAGGDLRTSASEAGRGGPGWLIASVDELATWRVVAGNLLAGAVAGCTVEAALFPIDTIKTRLQAMRSGGGMRALLRGGGAGRLYSGIFGNLAGVAPATALFFAVYEPFKQLGSEMLPKEQEKAGPLLAGAMAGLVASTIRVPTEVVKQRMQTGEFRKFFGAVKGIVGREGPQGLFAGYGAFLLRDLPFDAIEFFTYEFLKSTYEEHVLRPIHSGEAAVAGAVAGGVTGLLTTPFDVMKTRLMTQGATGQYQNVLDCTAKVIREEGVTALFKGWQPRLVWISIGGCVFFTALEQARKAFVPQKPPPPPEENKGKKKR
ncbi:unnamed protein product [Ostreobium quekettii]|uniref:Uncharacterized protein n=1 Tax=Ostreobium quekettii TaxID=121088 RepID=A0A8S1JCM0_9CHLO|nr:unnamed protein product [Ostreobium quekettii]|eukprot:evm.model.scf_1675.1 EVM.evm.TU.scf_1675.1   scf_1675:11427-16666(+)